MSTEITFGGGIVVSNSTLKENQVIYWTADNYLNRWILPKKKIRRIARRYWAKHVRQHNVDVKIFTKKAEEFYNTEDIPRKTACQKARNVLCFETELKDLLK